MARAMHIRPATSADLPALHAVIERAYRGDSARLGWTFEADLLTGPRTDLAELQSLLDDPAQTLLMATGPDGRSIGSVMVADRGDGVAYLGMLSIEPTLQAAGLGRRLIGAAEDHAVRHFGARTMEMTVIDARAELIAYYQRRGYALTGETRPFPILMDPPFSMVVLAKSLAAPTHLG